MKAARRKVDMDFQFQAVGDVLFLNIVRPHSSLGYRPPAPEAIAWPPPAAADAALGVLPLDPGFLPSVTTKRSNRTPEPLTMDLVPSAGVGQATGR